MKSTNFNSVLLGIEDKNCVHYSAFAVFMPFVSLLIALLITVSHACFLAVR